MPAASNGISVGIEGWGCNCPQHRDLLIAVGPDGAIKQSSRRPRRSIPLSRRPALRCPVASPRRRAARPGSDTISLRLGFSAVNAAAPLAPEARTGRPRCGASRESGSTRAHARPGRSFRIYSENSRCVTGVQRRGRPRLPFSKISRHPTVGLPVQSAAQGEHALVRIVQHFGSGRESWRRQGRPRGLPGARRRFRELDPNDLSRRRRWASQSGGWVVRVTSIVTGCRHGAGPSPSAQAGALMRVSPIGKVTRRGPEMLGTTSQAFDG
jgi:hypothetical protein